MCKLIRYIKIPYFMPGAYANPNGTLITTDNTVTYKCKNMYIFKATHHIVMDTPYDGELVVEMEPTGNNSGILFACFLLRNIRKKHKSTSILDRIIATSENPPNKFTSFHFNLKQYINEKQKKIIYASGNDNVVIYTTPIHIHHVSFSKYKTIPVTLFAPYPVDKKYQILQIKESYAGLEGFQEGKTNKSIGTTQVNNEVMTCTPIDMDDNEQGENTATYLMDSNTAQQMKNMGVAYAMMITLVLVMAAYLGAPPIFQSMIVQGITSSELLTINTLVFLTLSLLFSFILLLNGSIYDTKETMTGVMLLVFIVLSTMSVANARLSDTKIMIPIGPIGMNKFTYNALMVWSQTVVGIIGKQFGGILRWFIGLFIVLIIPCAVIWAKKDKQSNRQEKKTRGYRNNVTGLILGIGLSYGLIAIIYAYSFDK